MFGIQFPELSIAIKMISILQLTSQNKKAESTQNCLCKYSALCNQNFSKNQLDVDYRRLTSYKIANRIMFQHKFSA